MSIRVMSEVWKTKLPLSEKMVLLVIADHASDEGDNAWPSQATIAAKSSLSIRTVQRCVNNLVKAGYLKLEKHAGGSANCREDRRPHRYTIYLSRLRGVELTGRRSEPNGAAETPDTGRRSRPMNHTNKPSINPDESFDLFWEIYPKKVGRLAAEKAYRKALESGFESESIIAGAKSYAADKNRSEAYTAHPATWLNAGRWADEQAPVVTRVENKFDPKEYEEQAARAVPMPDYFKDLFKKP